MEAAAALGHEGKMCSSLNLKPIKHIIYILE